MKLIVGLGNPGNEYKNTRHNVGFIVVDNYLKNEKWTKEKNYDYVITNVFGEKVCFLKPLTYMNMSGQAVSKIVNFYKINMQDILIIQDDLDMDTGTYKIKRNSSSGGHNGIKSIISELHTEEFARLKIGISKSAQIPVDKYVLAKFSTDELNKINANLDTFNGIIDYFIKFGIEEAMAKYNKN